MVRDATLRLLNGQATASDAFDGLPFSSFCYNWVMSDPTPREVIAYSWIFGGDLSIDLAFLIDPLSAIMLMVVTCHKVRQMPPKVSAFGL